MPRPDYYGATARIAAAANDDKLAELEHKAKAKVDRAKAHHDPTLEVERLDTIREVRAQRRELAALEPPAPWVVIPCSAAKADSPAPAADLYRGSYFRQALTTARQVTREDRILVLSGRHGLLALDAVVAPYEQRIDRPGAVSTDELAAQVDALDLARARDGVLVLAGRAYADRLREVLPSAFWPMARARGIGDHLATLRLTRELVATPAAA